MHNKRAVEGLALYIRTGIVLAGLGAAYLADLPGSVRGPVRGMQRKAPGAAASRGGVTPMGSRSARATLGAKLNSLLDELQLSQSEAAEILGIPQPRISAIRNNKLQGISLERLMEALIALGQRVEIRVSASNRPVTARIEVAA
jgi:predicted XRE-type DNA-binding protein